MMARVPRVEEPSTEDDREYFERVWTRVPASVDSFLFNSPPAADVFSVTREFIVNDMVIPDRVRELGDIVVGLELGSALVVDRHRKSAVQKSGLAAGTLDALEAGRYNNLSEDDRVVAQYAREIVHGIVSEGSFGAVKDRLGVRGIVEYTFFICTVAGMARFVQALGIESDHRQGKLSELLERLERDAGLEA